MSDARLANERRVHDAIEALVPTYTSLLQTLVRIPSPIGEEAAAQREVEAAMRALDLVIDTFDIDAAALAGTPGFTAPARDYAGRPCVVGKLKGSGGGRSMALNAHIDTALVDPAGRWTHDPFSGHIDGDLIYGRGAWDDKAGVVETLLVAEAFQKSGVTLRGDLILKSVVEDEATGNGTLACLSRGHHADAAIIVDGTWPERFIVSHMGQLWFRIELRGRSAPASVAVRGANPLAAIGPVLAQLRGLADSRNAATQPWGSNAAPVFINVGQASGGAWEGAVPAGCVLRGQFGFVPPDTPATARAALADAVVRASELPDWPEGVIGSIGFDGLESPVVIGDPANAIVQAIAATVQRSQGMVIQESVITGHCDLRHYQSNPWRAPVPACLYGPGGGKNAHSEDEHFNLTHLPLIARNLASVILEWCG